MARSCLAERKVVKGMAALADLVGLDDPVDPAAMQFTAKPSKSCHGCVFKGQRTSVCREASRLAVLAGFKDCDEGVVYVALDVDLKQTSIV
jgi:hypothetical protein